VEGDTIPALDASEIAEQRGELIDSDVELLVGNCQGGFVLQLGHPDQRRFVTIFRQVAINAVVTGVEPTTNEPLPERRVAGVQGCMPGLIPGE
jgi:hypothetical protein